MWYYVIDKNEEGEHVKVFVVNLKYTICAENITIARNLAECYYSKVESVIPFEEYVDKYGPIYGTPI